MNFPPVRPYSLPALAELVCEKLVSQKQYGFMRDGIALEKLPAHTLMLRFDVERDLAHHRKVAEMLTTYGIPCTMYFNTRKDCYHPSMLKRIEAMGCEVGYHHECLDRCEGDFAQARELFLREVEMFRKDGLNLQTTSPCSELGLRKNGYRGNQDLFQRYPDLLKEAGLVGDAFHKAWKNPPLYASDTFSNYSQFWQKIMEGAATPRPLVIAAHPHRWRHNPIISGLEVSRDILRGLSNKAVGKRSYDFVV